jgi:hypothetical protein
VSGISRPGIWHLLLWMTCCAIYLSLMRWFLPPTGLRSTDIIQLSLFALYTGLCWTGALLVIGRTVRPAGFPLEPGAWLLFALGCILAVDLLTAMLSDRPEHRSLSWRLSAGCLAWAAPTLSRDLPGRWKALFAMLAILATARLVWSLVAVSYRLPPMPRQAIRGYALVQLIAGLTALLAVALRDRQLRRRDGWLHWTGIACLVVWLRWCASVW